MIPKLVEPILAAGSEVVWVDAAGADQNVNPIAEGEALTISQMAAKFGVTPRTLRFYESKGLLSPAREGRGRIYTQKDQQHIALILKGRKLGFTISEITQMIKAEDGTASSQALRMTREKCLEQIEHLELQMKETAEALTELRRMHMQLSGR
jgi:DNA-binding transcriptional MerR regulator